MEEYSRKGCTCIRNVGEVDGLTSLIDSLGQGQISEMSNHGGVGLIWNHPLEPLKIILAQSTVFGNIRTLTSYES